MGKLIELLDKLIPGKGWRTYVVTVIVAAVLNYLPKFGIGVTEELSVAITTVVMTIVAFVLRTITSSPVGSKI